jgi:hypothetical protein
MPASLANWAAKEPVTEEAYGNFIEIRCYELETRLTAPDQ